ncbi:hypothetical protein LINGRAPRIM_LOCUS3419 [Linum grandiflorum]
MEEWKRSGQIPAFGDWKNANELPITQYFECARQAGLIRYSNSSGECDCPAADYHHSHNRQHRSSYAAADFNNSKQKHQYRNNYNQQPQRKTRLREKRGPTAQVKDTNLINHQQGRVRDITNKPRHQKKHSTVENDAVAPPPPPSTAAQRPRNPVRAPKPVDEDLYKIPPHLLRSSKRKKVPGFLACFVPSACAS